MVIKESTYLIHDIEERDLGFILEELKYNLKSLTSEILYKKGTISTDYIREKLDIMKAYTYQLDDEMAR
jgi:hypothetical protein